MAMLSLKHILILRPQVGLNGIITLHQLSQPCFYEQSFVSPKMNSSVQQKKLSLTVQACNFLIYFMISLFHRQMSHF